MTRLVSVTLLGVALAAGCATAKGTHKVAWRCEEGRYPDANKPVPNCESDTPLPGSLSARALEQQQALSQAQQDLQARQQALDESQRQLAELQAQQPAPGAEAETEAEATATAEAKLEKRVDFAVGSAEIREPTKAVLDEVAVSVREDPSVSTIVVEGHADATGATELNNQLSEERAQAVKDYLASRGVDADRIETRALGESQPVATNESAEGRAMNRAAVVLAME